MSDSKKPSEGPGHEKPDEHPEWPAHFPPCCPPTDAAPLSGIVYMLVATNPPTATDTECAMDRGTHKNGDPCLRASLSCARDANHLTELRKAVTRLKGHMVAAASLDATHGKIKQTGRPGHFSMWLRARILKVAHTLFKVGT